MNRERLDMRIFPQIASFTKKRPLKVISTAFLFREVEQLAVYQLLPDLAIGEDFSQMAVL